MLPYKLSVDGYSLIVCNEGRKNKSYPDSKGKPTIGIGHLILDSEKWMLNTILTEDQVKNIFFKDLKPREDWLNIKCKNWAVPMTQYEFDALCSFSWQYYLDNPNYAGTKAAIISGIREAIIEHMLQFVNIEAGSGKKELLLRRQRELSMFMTGSWA